MWNGILKIVEIQQVDENGKVLWEEKNIHNMLHTIGQQFILNTMFVGGATSPYIPANYYFGLDNRTSIAAVDTMTLISSSGEPSTNGYIRQTVASSNQFVVSLVDGIYVASSPVLSFSAVSGGWGPVSNLFMTDQSGYSGTLISSAALTQTITLTSGQAINMRLSLSLSDCSACS